MADRAEGVPRVTGARPAMVFGELSVQHMEAALDQPASPQVLKQERGVGLFPRKARDRIRSRRADLALVDGVPFEADELFRPRPVEISRLDQVGGRGDDPRLQPAPAFFPGQFRLAPLQFFLNCIGGESLRGSRRLGRHLAEVEAGWP